MTSVPAHTRQQPEPFRVAIVEDHLLQRQRTEQIIVAQRGLRVVYSCETLPQLVEWLAHAPAGSRPDLLVLDLVVDREPDADPAVVAALVASGVRILVLSAMASSKLVQGVLQAGVSGIVGKRDNPETVVAAAWAVLDGSEWMTPELASVIAGDTSRPTLSIQEERALVLYASGLTMDSVAAALGVKRDTAKTYVNRVKDKYAAAGRPVHTKLDLMRVATQDGYVAPDRV